MHVPVESNLSELLAPKTRQTRSPRVVHVTYPFSINGCTRASAKTASPLVATETHMFLDVAKDIHVTLGFSATQG